MKRYALGLLVFSCGLLALANEAQAGRRRVASPYPPRYQRGSYAELIARPTPNGQVKVRQVYNGYVDKFPPPAYLFYGYPHSGDNGGNAQGMDIGIPY